MNFSAVKQFLGRGYQQSVVRRAMLLAGLVVPAFGANFLVQYFAAVLLAPENFGVFYVANTLSNVLFSGSFILNIYFTRHLVFVAESAGTPMAFAAVRRIERTVVLWGAVVSAIVFVALAGVATQVGVQSRLVLLLVILDVYTSYVTDLGRVALQSLRRTVSLGLYSLVWMGLRLILCVLGMLLFGSVWAVLLGVIASTCIVYVGFHVWAARSAGASRSLLPALPSLTEFLPLIVGYGLVIVVSNLDVLFSYFLLSDVDLGIYSASSVFPKAILVVIMPLLQMLFSLMVGSRVSNQNFRLVVGKTGGVVLALAVAGAGAVWIMSSWLCGGRWGLRLCEPGTLDVLLFSVVPLALMRVVILLQFARGRDWIPVALILPVLAYLWFAWNSPRNIETVAAQFVVFSAAAFVFLVLVHVVFEAVRKPTAT